MCHDKFYKTVFLYLWMTEKTILSGFSCTDNSFPWFRVLGELLLVALQIVIKIVSKWYSNDFACFYPLISFLPAYPILTYLLVRSKMYIIKCILFYSFSSNWISFLIPFFSLIKQFILSDFYCFSLSSFFLTLEHFLNKSF